MKTFFLTIALISLPAMNVFAHEGGEIAAGSVEAGWQGPAFAVLIIFVAIVAARIISKKTKVVDESVNS